MSFIKEQIEKAHKKGEMITVCLGKIDWNKRTMGYVRKIYAFKFKIEIIDEFGQKKGAKIFLFEAVKSLELGGIYSDNLEKLSKGGWVKSTSAPKYAIAGKNNLYKKLNELMEAKVVCTFFFGTEFSIGKVTRVTQEEFSITNIGFDGTRDCISYFDMASLTKIRWASNFEKRISFLTKE